VLVAILAVVASGCGDGGPKPRPRAGDASKSRRNPSTSLPRDVTKAQPVRETEMGRAILSNVYRLLETASLRPGGENINIATSNLNQYFKGLPDEKFALSGEARAFLTEQLEGTNFRVEPFEDPNFDVPDARHIEDCLLYHQIANRVAGPGSALDRVRRLFDWTCRYVQLVPQGRPMPAQFIEQGIEHVPARPYDVLVRGQATEIPGDVWAERSWVFLSLCRQIGVDAAMLAYPVDEPRSAETPSESQQEAASEENGSTEDAAAQDQDQDQDGGEGEDAEAGEDERENVFYWICGVLIDGRVYLFDTRSGLEIPGPDGTGVATMDEAATIPAVLDRLDLPGAGVDYPTEAKDLESVFVYLDSSRGYFAPKMRLLQGDLAGENRIVLYRDPAEQRDAWTEALGDRLEAVRFWPLPLQVELALFTRPNFVTATQVLNSFFDPRLPLLGARLRQLRGDLAEAKRDYLRFRFRDTIRIGNESIRLPETDRHSLDLFATYFLALAQLEDGNRNQAIFLFEQALDLPPGEPRQGLLATLTRWGVHANLGLIHESLGNRDKAIRHYAEPNPTTQRHANLFRAQALVWEHPFAPPPEEVSSEAEPDSEDDGDEPRGPEATETD